MRTVYTSATIERARNTLVALPLLWKLRADGTPHLDHAIERLAALQPVLEAVLAGKPVQYLDSKDGWVDTWILDFSAEPKCYRVKPVPKPWLSRRYLYQGPNGEASVGMSTVKGTRARELEEQTPERATNFIRWLDSEWLVTPSTSPIASDKEHLA